MADTTPTRKIRAPGATTPVHGTTVSRSSTPPHHATPPRVATLANANVEESRLTKLQRENDELRRRVIELRKDCDAERLKAKQAHREKVLEVKQVRGCVRVHSKHNCSEM